MCLRKHVWYIYESYIEKSSTDKRLKNILFQLPDISPIKASSVELVLQ